LPKHRVSERIRVRLAPPQQEQGPVSLDLLGSTRMFCIARGYGAQYPKSLPLDFDAVHVEPASVVQSEGPSQTVIPGAGHDAMHLVPVKLFHSGQVTPQWVAVVAVPVPQQTGVPASRDVQSIGASHCQSTEPVTGHAVPIASHVEGVEDPTGTSQQCWPGLHVMGLPASSALKGQ
jgi:hypothetical protein